MALINRISRLFTADFHAVLDRIEEPETLLRQSIREMEDELESRERRLRHANLDLVQVQAREQELDESISGYDDELDICFESDEEGLARNLIRRKLETERLLKSTRARRELLQANVAELQQGLEEDQARLDTMRQKAAVLIEESSPDCGAAGTEFSVRGDAVLDEEIEVAFLKEKQKRSAS